MRKPKKNPYLLSPWMKIFFQDYLIAQKGASPHTIHSYRDAMKLLLEFVCQKSGQTSLSPISIFDIDISTILEYLSYLEDDRDGRGVCARTRNCRLAAIHSFFKIPLLKPLSQDPLHKRSSEKYGKRIPLNAENVAAR